MKNSIVKICKIASIVCFNTTKTDQEFIFQQLYCNSSNLESIILQKRHSYISPLIKTEKILKTIIRKNPRKNIKIM
ncbi:hypothetical protein B2G47_01155 [Leptospira interrogans serovar Canicola]|nr:hypothetical protein B2G47_01155 [Leptospira interrogans serovar Canicola]